MDARAKSMLESLAQNNDKHFLFDEAFTAIQLYTTSASGNKGHKTELPMFLVRRHE